MTRDLILSAISRVLSEELQYPDLVLTPTVQLSELDGWDSVTGSCVMISIENEFGFEFDGNVLERVSTVDSLVEMVESKQAENRTQN